MIFSPELAKLILQGKKTQTRRPAATKVCRYHAGRSYAIQPGRGKRASGRITITDVRMEALGEISLKDARREGFVTRDEFFDYWCELHGSANPDLRVWVISFALGDQTDSDRFLAARPGAPHGDYVTSSFLGLRDEPPAVDAVTQQRLTEQGTLRWQQERAHREAARVRKHLHERLRELERRYKLGEAKLEPQLRVIRQQIRDLQRRAA